MNVPSLHPPSLKVKAPKRKLADVLPIIGKVLCACGKHNTYYHEWEDRHGGGSDGMSQCLRCKEWDV